MEKGSVHPYGGHHLLAHNSTLAAVATMQQVAGIADPVFSRSVANDYQMFDDYAILGAYAGSAACVRARLSQPSQNLKGVANVVPISGVHLPAVDPNFMELTGNPYKLYRGENLRAEMESNSATSSSIYAWLMNPKYHDFSVKHKNLRWIRGTVAVTTVVQTWALGGALTLDDPLEGGRYTVYGMQAFFATALAARLVFNDQVLRPGCLGQATAVSRSAELFRGGLGAWGDFDQQALPQVEVLDTAAAAVTYTVWLLIGHERDRR